MTVLPVLLSKGFTAKVVAGQKVAEGQIVAEKKTKEIKIIALSKSLNVSPKEVLKYLKKKPGDKIVVKEVLAVKKGILGAKKLLSPFSGIITKLEEDSGNLFIELDLEENQNIQEITSPVDGEIASVSKEKIEIKTDKNVLSARVALGKNSEGEIFLLTEEEVDSDNLYKEIQGKIILGKKFSKASIFKAVALNAKGIVGIDLNDVEFKDFAEKVSETPVFLIGESDFNKLSGLSGKRLFLSVENKTIIIL